MMAHLNSNVDITLNTLGLLLRNKRMKQTISNLVLSTLLKRALMIQ